jgi:hypothetical protein
LGAHAKHVQRFMALRERVDHRAEQRQKETKENTDIGVNILIIVAKEKGRPTLYHLTAASNVI